MQREQILLQRRAEPAEIQFQVWNEYDYQRTLILMLSVGSNT